MKRLTFSIKKNLQKLLIAFLLLYSSLILSHQILGKQPPLILYIPFLIFVPGYAFSEALLPQITKLEKITISIALSIALFVGLESSMKTFEITGLFTETSIMTIISILCLVIALVKNIRK